MQQWLNDYQQQLSRQLIAQQLPHALLFQGVTGAGKTALADWLVQVLLCQASQLSAEQILQACGQCKNCLLHAKQSFPDHLAVVSEKTSIGVDDIRHASAFLQKTAQMSGYQTIVIANAETMTEAAANALLKTLEEPSAQSIIILLTSDVERLLPTIISRCRVIEIRPYVGRQLIEHLSVENQDNYINLTHLPELLEHSVLNQQAEFEHLYFSFLQGQNVRSELSKMLVESEHAMRWLEQLLVNLYRQSFQWPIKTYPILAVLTSDKVYLSYQVFLSTKKQLLTFQQANKTLLIEKMLIDINTLTQ